MKITWCTTRHFNSDLCSTTQVELLNRLTINGNCVRALGPDQPTSPIQWNHVKINQSRVRGRKGSSLAKNIVRFLENNHDGCELLLIDWPLVGKVGVYADKKKIPWICIDRSPPADSGILASMQMNVWAKAWKYVSKSMNNGECIGGTVVSNAHQEMISRKFQIECKMLCILMAGVNVSQFKPKTAEERLRGVNLVYHGRIDRNRGIMNLPLILEGLLDKNIDAKLHFIGDGDVYHLLEHISKSQPNLILHGKLNHSEIPEKISSCHIGLLPMPSLPAWIISSPLKRSEYLASGLVVLGVNHPGHYLPSDEQNTEWYSLIEQQNFVSDSVEQIIKWGEKNNYSERGLDSRAYAEKNLDWSISVNSLTSWIHQQLE